MQVPAEEPVLQCCPHTQHVEAIRNRGAESATTGTPHTRRATAASMVLVLDMPRATYDGAELETKRRITLCAHRASSA